MGLATFNYSLNKFVTATLSIGTANLVMVSISAVSALAQEIPDQSIKRKFGSAYIAQSITGDDPDKLPPVLPPSQFFGAAAMGYAAAKAVPKVCHKLFCYCGCDITDRHKNLLDCFVTIHGADCHICQEEALMALKMNRAEKNLEAIQKSVDQTYKKDRLWTRGKTKSEVSKTETKGGDSKTEACCNGEKK
jgi:hypothetical protein